MYQNLHILHIQSHIIQIVELILSKMNQYE